MFNEVLHWLSGQMCSPGKPSVLCAWIKLLLCCNISFLSPVRPRSHVENKTKTKHAHVFTNTHNSFKLAAACEWVDSLFAAVHKHTATLMQGRPWLRDTNTGRQHRRKTGMKNSAGKMRINGCQSPCGIGNQWSIKAAFPQQTDKIAWIRSAWHFS